MKLNFSVLMLMVLFSILNFAYANELKKACFNVEGMTCSSCTVTTKAAIKKLEGIIEINVSLENKNAIISFDPKKTTSKKIKSRIDSVGYKATEVQCSNL